MSHVMLRGLTLSIVIPTPGDTGALEETLLSVLENRPEGCEVVVALACEYDDPWNLAEEVRFVRAPAGAGLVGCVTAGVQATTGDVIHLLAAGWKATPGWTDAAVARFDDATTGAVIPLGVDGATPDRVVSAGLKFKRGGRRVALTRPGMGTTAAVGSGADRRVGARRPRWPVVGPRLEAGFWRADLVRAGGAGFSTACGDRLADVDMAVELAARGCRRSWKRVRGWWLGGACVGAWVPFGAPWGAAVLAIAGGSVVPAVVPVACHRGDPPHDRVSSARDGADVAWPLRRGLSACEPRPSSSAVDGISGDRRGDRSGHGDSR